MAQPGLVVCRVRSCDPRWRGAMAGGGGVMAVFSSRMAGLCRAVVSLTSRKDTDHVHYFHQSFHA